MTFFNIWSRFYTLHYSFVNYNIILDLDSLNVLYVMVLSRLKSLSQDEINRDNSFILMISNYTVFMTMLM